MSTHSRWSLEETELLIEKYESTSNVELCKMFPNRSQLGIYKKAKSLGLSKSDAVKFVDRSNARKMNPSDRKPMIYSSKGYKLLYMPDHPRADKGGYVFKHIVVWEHFNKCSVPEGFYVHHVNGKKTDNRIENLSILSASGHTRIHNLGRKLSKHTREKMAESARNRFSDPKRHPSYKSVNASELVRMRKNGASIKEICEKFEIDKTTYYSKLKKAGVKCTTSAF